MSRAQGKGASLSSLVHGLRLTWLVILSVYQSVPVLGLRVLAALRAITFVNMHPRPHPILLLQLSPARPPRLVVPHAAGPEKNQGYWHTTTRVRAPPPLGSLGPIIVPSSRQRYPNSSHSITIPTTRVHTGRAPLRAMIVRWRSRGNSTNTRDCSRTPRTIRMPLQGSGHYRSLPRIRSVAFLTVPIPDLSH
jgi:hypothetical protein